MGELHETDKEEVQVTTIEDAVSRLLVEGQEEG